METSCGVVLVNFGSILLLQYPQGHWDFPKGHVEESDTDRRDTAARELKKRLEFLMQYSSKISSIEQHTIFGIKEKNRQRGVLVYSRNRNDVCKHKS